MIKKYYANKDNTVTNAFEDNLKTRGTGSNMGASDILEVFSIYGQESSGSTELSRVLLEFDTSIISSDRLAGTVAASGSTSWYLRMYSAPHSSTTPKDFKLVISAVSASWQEGSGLDMENYQDLTNDNIGSNWIKRTGTTSWTSVGGDYHELHRPEQTFNTGFEDLEVDVTHMVEDWLASRKSNNGFGIRLSSSYEAYFSSSNGQASSSVPHNAAGARKSYYRKKFFGRDSEFFFKRPTLEARWDDSKKDDRGNFFYSSSLAPAADNLNTLYFYNYVRGRLRNIPSIGEGNIMVSLYSGSGVTPSGPALTLVGDGTHVRSNWPLVVTGTHSSTGIYAATFALTGSPSLTSIYDVWFSGSHSITSSLGSNKIFMTGTVSPMSLSASQVTENQNYVLSMPNLKELYKQSDTPKFRLYVRKKNWNPNIYTTAVRKSIPSLLIESASYQIKRATDDEIVVPYGTGSYYHTGLSYDVSGNYFKFDMNLLEKGYQYEIYYSFYNEDTLGYVEQPYKFKFRVSEE